MSNEYLAIHAAMAPHALIEYFQTEQRIVQSTRVEDLFQIYLEQRFPIFEFEVSISRIRYRVRRLLIWREYHHREIIRQVMIDLKNRQRFSQEPVDSQSIPEIIRRHMREEEVV